jgi:hypothetical protein
MKKLFLLKSLLLLCALVVGSSSVWGQNYEWVLVTDYSSLSTDDVYVIAGNNSSGGTTWYSLKNNQVTTAAYLSVGSTLTINNNKITSNVSSDETWTLEETSTTGEYCIKSTKGNYYLVAQNGTKSFIKAKTNSNNDIWKIHQTESYNNYTVTGLYNKGQSRVLAVYNGSNGNDWRCYASANYSNIDGEEVVLFKRVVAASGEATTVTIDALGITNTDIASSTEAGSLSAVVKDASDEPIDNATVTWSSSKPAVATIDETTGAITLVKKGSTTITASYAGVENTYLSSSETYVLNVTNSAANDGSAEKPFTPSEAKDAYDANELDAETEYYVTGIIQSVISYNSTDKSLNYWISDDGTTTNRMESYKGKGLNGADFDSAEDLEAGDIVTIKGKLKVYNSTFEFDEGNQITALTQRTKVNLESLTFNLTKLVLGEVTEATAIATIDQTGCNTAIFTYESLDENIATCTSAGVINAVAKGGARIKVTLSIPATDPNYKLGTVKTKMETITVANPSHTVTFSVNGVTSEASVEEGVAITFPDDPAAIDGKSFVGWTTEAIDGITDTAPTFVTSATMGDADVIYYAVFANKKEDTQVTDNNLTITNSDFTDALTGSYADKTIVKTIGETNYTIDLNACKQNEMCQMRDNATLSYIHVPTLPGNITNISTTECHNAGTDGYTGTIHIKTSKTRGNADTNDITKASLSSATSFSIDLTGENKSFYLLTSAGLRIKDLTVTYRAEATVVTYSEYCTTVVPGPSDPDVNGETVTLTTTANMNGWRAFYDENQGYTAENAKVYVVSSNSTTKVILSDIGSDIPAGTPVILKANTGLVITLTESTPAAYTGDNELNVSTDGQDLGTVYRLGYSDDNGVGFYQFTSSSAPAGIVYLENVNGAPSLGIEIGDATAIEAATKSQLTETVVYNLNGQRVAQPTKGLYIVNGRKVIIK